MNFIQPKEEKREWKPGDCPHCGRPMPSAPTDAVEEKIQRLRELYESLAPNSRIDFDGLVLDLRQLVRMARKTK